jgi:hypothetical protein
VLGRFRFTRFATRALRVTNKLRSAARTPEVVTTQSELRLQSPPFPKRPGRRPLKFPNLIISLTRFGHVLEGSPAPPGSIWPRPRRPVIEIWQIWGLVSAPVKYLPLTYPFGLTSSAAPRRIERRGLSHGSMGYTSRVLIPRFSHRAPVTLPVRVWDPNSQGALKMARNCFALPSSLTTSEILCYSYVRVQHSHQ